MLYGDMTAGTSDQTVDQTSLDSLEDVYIQLANDGIDIEQEQRK
jgi:hypothetical protein